MADDDKLIRNRPCATGRALGENMARFADRAEQEWREQLGIVAKRCASCAFTKGTFPNGCLSTMADATKCVLEDRPFYCHHATADGIEPICAGWLMLRGPNLTPAVCPWPFAGKDA